MRVHSLHIYPVKGVRGVSCDHAEVRPRGFAGDRRWLITDEGDQFLSQRTCPDLARLEATPTSQQLRLSIEGGGDCNVAHPIERERNRVTVWGDKVAAMRADAKAEAWLSDVLRRDVRLYFMDDPAIRHTSGRWGAVSPVSFADGYPFLVTTTASLDALNDEIKNNGGASVGMDRFRPNIVVDGNDPWTEDRWAAIKIGDVVIELVKPCARCEVTTKDQVTGEKLGKEPLKTLAKIRRSAHPDLNGVLFGWNGFARDVGGIKTGDQATIIEDRPDGWPIA